MPKRNEDGFYTCAFCGMGGFKTLALVDDHADKEHHLIYFPMTPEECNRLLSFIFSLDRELLNEDFVRRLQRYNRLSALKQIRGEN